MEKRGAQWKSGVAQRYYSEEQTRMRIEFNYSNVILRDTCTIKFHLSTYYIYKLSINTRLLLRIMLLLFIIFFQTRAHILQRETKLVAFQNIFMVHQFTLKV